jgi:gamma-tubulin complex component 3
VLSENAMGRYHQLFNTLWRIKRIEAILSVLWKNQTSLFKLQRVLPELGSVLHRSQLLISEMIHFVHQTQYYIMFEATECAWDRLMMDVEKSSDLDEVISAHESFLDTVTNRSLLNSSSRKLLNQLRGIFDTVHEFKDFLNKFDSSVMVEYERRKNIKIHSPEQLREAQKEFFKKFVSHAKGKVETIYTAFQDLVRAFLLKLNRQQELNLQCLSFRLDFNEHYQQKDSRLTQPLTYQHRRLSMGNVLPSGADFSILTTSMENSFNAAIPEYTDC